MSLDSPAQGKSLDNDYGASKGSAAAATHHIRVYDGDPTAAGSELTGTGGVSRVSVTNNGTNWPTSTGDVKSNGVKFSHPASTGAWAATGTWMALVNTSTGDIWDYGELDTPVDITGAGQTLSWDIGDIAITTG